jgi:hypothetical protein
MIDNAFAANFRLSLLQSLSDIVEQPDILLLKRLKSLVLHA